VSQEDIIVKIRKTGKGAARACRRQGLIPAVIYGKNMEPISVSLDAKATKSIFGKRQGHIHHVKLEDSRFEGDVMVQDVEREPFTGKVIHLDLHRISLKEKVRTEIPIVIVGESDLEKRGLILQRQLREVLVECLPQDIPENFTVDVSRLNPGETVTCGELQIPKEVRLMTPPHEVVVVAVTAKAAEAAEEEAEKKEVETQAGPVKEQPQP